MKNRPVASGKRTVELRNPLMRAMGTVMGELRRAKGMIADDAAAKLGGIPGSSYRMIESGAANLQPSKALRLAGAYEELDPQAVAALVLIMDFVWDPPPGDIAALKPVLDRVTSVYPSFKSVATVLRTSPSLLSARPSDEEAAALAEELGAFLRTNPTEGKTGLRESYNRRFADSSRVLTPLLLETVFHMFESLRGVKFRFTPNELYDFEKKHEQKFKTIAAVVSDERMFLGTTKHNGVLAYGYLFRKNFDRLDIVVRGECNERQVRDEFLAELRRTYRGQPIGGRDFEDACDKVFVHGERERNRGTESPEIDQLLTHSDVRHRNLWLYQLTDTQVGFVDNAAPDGPAEVTGEVLGLDDLSEKSDRLRRYIARLRSSKR